MSASDAALLRFSEHFEAEAAIVLRHACRLSLEGIISKQANGKSRNGRTKAWAKSKCSERQEFIVAGYVQSPVSRKTIGSLVRGYHAHTGNMIHVVLVVTGKPISYPPDPDRRTAK